MKKIILNIEVDGEDVMQLADLCFEGAIHPDRLQELLEEYEGKVIPFCDLVAEIEYAIDDSEALYEKDI
jgi:hypothetical protein